MVITDTETTGVDASVHEIIEIGAVLIDQRTLKILNIFESKVRPEHPQTRIQKSIDINGYNAKAWKNAPSLRAVMRRYSQFTQDALFCAHNVSFDWKFIECAFSQTKVPNLWIIIKSTLLR